MKKFVSIMQACLVVAVFVIAGAGAASAQSFFQDTSQRAPEVSDVYIAMLYNKRLGQIPNFADWAMTTTAYAYADRYEQLEVRAKIVKNLEEAYKLVGIEAPFQVNIVVNLKPYIEYNSFSIENFSKATYFAFEYLGEKYAVIPSRVEDRQFIELTPTNFKRMIEETKPAGKGYMQISLRPTSVDGTGKMTLDGQDYWLMMADIVDLELWNQEGTYKYWDMEEAMAQGGVVNANIRGLYRE